MTLNIRSSQFKTRVTWVFFTFSILLLYISYAKSIRSRFVTANKLYSKCKAILKQLNSETPTQVDLFSNVNVIIYDSTGQRVFIDTKKP